MNCDNYNNQLSNIINKLVLLIDELKNLNINENNTIAVKKILYIKKSVLAHIILEIRELYSVLPYPAHYEALDLDTFDEDLSQDLNIIISVIDFYDFYSYKIKLPIILPRTKSSLNRVLLTNSFQKAYNRLLKISNSNLPKINNPIIVFENHFIKDSEHNGVKDLDNYEISDVLNIIQTYFIHDDRTASIYQRNVFNSFENYTLIYILEESNFISFFSQNLKNKNDSFFDF